MRVYYCMKCDYSSTDVTTVSLMPDGYSEYCDPCYESVKDGK
jgi:hypothetical protein